MFRNSLMANLYLFKPPSMQKVFRRLLPPFYFFILSVFFSLDGTAGFVRSSPLMLTQDTGLIGRWDISIAMNGKWQPSWLEVTRSGTKTLIGQFVGTGGSARPISRIDFTNGHCSFSIPPQWDLADGDLTFNGDLAGDSLSGLISYASGKMYKYVARRAPDLVPKREPEWDKPVLLFNGTNLEGWHATGDNQWIADSGLLRSPHHGSNLVSDKTFTDFKLHIEFRYPPGSNSGVYLRGRYELQIVDDDQEPKKNEFGSIYGFIAPIALVAKKPNEWQTFDVTLIGRTVSVVANGITVICNQEIPGITGGAIDCHEEQPGPLLLQGDHESVDFRNIILTPPK
jgi:hypothetical protein